jgi:hypothetical protein
MANDIKYLRIDEDGIPVAVTEHLQSIASIDAITPKETLAAGVWTKITSKQETDLVAWKVTEVRAIPGNAIEEDKLDSENGIIIHESRIMKDVTAITPSEAVVAGVWTQVESKAITELVAWEITTTRTVPGDGVPSARVGGDDIPELLTATLVEASTVTPAASESAGVITKTTQEPISLLVSKQVVSTKSFLDEAKFSASIPVIIPERFRGIVETDEESHIVAGTAAAPTLGAGELERVETQRTKLLKEVLVRRFGSVTLPVVLTDTAIDKEGVETTLVFTFDTDSGQTLNSGAAANFTQGEITHIGAGFILMTEIFDTLPAPWRTTTEPDKDGVILTTKKRKNLVSAITAGEAVASSIWTRTSAQAENGTIAEEVQISRSVA